MTLRAKPNLFVLISHANLAYLLWNVYGNTSLIFLWIGELGEQRQ